MRPVAWLVAVSNGTPGASKAPAQLNLHSGLENRRTLIASPGFESLVSRQDLHESLAKAGLLRFWGLVIPGYLGSWSNSKGQEHRPEWEGTDFQLIQWIERVRAASSVAVDHVAAGYGNVDLASGCLD